MKQIGSFLATLSAGLFILSGLMAITLFNIDQKAFSPETYKAAFKEQGLYAAGPTIFTDMIYSSVEDSGNASMLLSLINKDQMSFVISSLLPPNELEALMDGVFDSFFSFLNDETDSISIPLVSIKQHIVSEGGVQVFTQILRMQPECTPEQILQMGFGFLSSSATLMMCKPPDEVMNLVTPLIQTQLQVIASNFPDQLAIAGSDLAGLIEFRTRLNKVRAVMRITPVIPLFFLLAIVIFAVRSLKGWLNWWGIPFLITGVLGAFLGLVGAPIVRFFMETFILQGNANMPAVFLDMMRNVVGSIASLILKPIAIEGIILALIGAGMVAVAIFLNWRSQQLISNS
jgi:hypothetical protein